MSVSAPSFELRSRLEPAFALPLNVESLGQAFTRYVAENTLATVRPMTLPEPVLLSPRLMPAAPERLASTFRIEGGLSGRALLNPEPLPAVTEGFTNTVVEVLVDPEGYVFSTVLAAGSGSTNDALALEFAQSRRFEPISPVGPRREEQPPAPMMEGTLIFEWRPALITNNPAVFP